MIEWTDGDGQRVVIQGDRISVYGAVSMRRRDGTVAVGADVPSDVAVGRNETPGELRLLVHLLDQDLRCLPVETPNLEDVWMTMGKLEVLVDSMAKTKESA